MPSPAEVHILKSKLYKDDMKSDLPGAGLVIGLHPTKWDWYTYRKRTQDACFCYKEIAGSPLEVPCLHTESGGLISDFTAFRIVIIFLVHKLSYLNYYGSLNRQTY